MSQSPEAVETAVAAQSLLGSRAVTFNFPKDKISTRRITQVLNPPSGTKSALIAVQGFDLRYTETDYELQNIQVSLSSSSTTAICTATLRDKNDNGQFWEGTVEGLVMFFG